MADPAAGPVVDLVKRAFGPGTIELDRVYVGDITYVRTWEGWLYLATVIDLASRRVVGWSMADHMRAELVCDALDMAIEHRLPPAGLIFHSDRGSQYTSGDFASLCQAHGIARSMSRPGQVPIKRRPSAGGPPPVARPRPSADRHVEPQRERLVVQSEACPPCQARSNWS